MRKHKTKWERDYWQGGSRHDPHMLDPEVIPEFDWKTPELERLHRENAKVISQLNKIPHTSSNTQD